MNVKGILVGCALIGVQALAVVPPAMAQGTGPVAAACSAEIGKLCAGKEHGGGAVRRCLEENRDKLSAACKSALDTTGPGRGAGRQQ